MRYAEKSCIILSYTNRRTRVETEGSGFFIYKRKKGVFFNILAYITLLVFALNILAVDCSFALQPELRLKREDFKPAFEIKYAVEQAKEIVDLIEEHRAIRARTLADIEKWLESTENAFEGVAFQVQDGQILIKMPQSDVLIRYYDPNISPGIPQGTISASYWQLDSKLNNNLARQLLYSDRLYQRTTVAAVLPSPEVQPWADEDRKSVV